MKPIEASFVLYAAGIQQETPRKRCVIQASSTQPVVEDTEQPKLVESVTERDLYGAW